MDLCEWLGFPVFVDDDFDDFMLIATFISWFLLKIKSFTNGLSFNAYSMVSQTHSVVFGNSLEIETAQLDLHPKLL